jgi:hypothetical protein
MAQDWTENLTPDEAQAALDVLKANKAPLTARKATELIRLRRALEAKVSKRHRAALPLVSCRARKNC